MTERYDPSDAPFTPQDRGLAQFNTPRQPKIQIRCYETMGMPNTTATCTTCNTTKNFTVVGAQRAGFKDDMRAAEWWATQHVCPDPNVPEIVLI